MLNSTTWRVRAGDRLRVALSDASFPWLTPVPDLVTISISGVQVALPVLPDDAGTAADVPALTNPVAGSPASGPTWTITRDPINDGIEIAFGGGFVGQFPGSGHRVEMREETSASVRRTAPAAAVVRGSVETTVHLDTGETVVARADVRLTRAGLWVRGELAIDDLTTYARTWDVPAPSVGEQADQP